MCILLALAGWPVGWAVADSGDVESLIREGVALRKQGKDEQALPYFQKANELGHTARTEGQLGLAEMAIGYWLDAELYLTRALQTPDHPWVAKNRSILEDALRTVLSNISEVTVAGSPAGATVAINGRQAGTLPLSTPVRVAKGRVEIEVRAPGYGSGLLSVQARGGDQQRIDVALQEGKLTTRSLDTSGPGIARQQRSARPEGATSPPRSLVDRSSPELAESEGQGGRRMAVWVLSAGAAAALIFGISRTIFWQVNRNAFADHRGPPPENPSLEEPLWQRDCGAGLPDRGGEACGRLYDASRTALTLSIVGYVASGVLAAGAVALWATAPPERHRGMAFGCVPGLQPGLECKVSF